MRNITVEDIKALHEEYRKRRLEALRDSDVNYAMYCLGKQDLLFDLLNGLGVGDGYYARIGGSDERTD